MQPRQEIEQAIFVERRARAHFRDDTLVCRATRLLVERRGRRVHRPQSPRGGDLAQLPDARVVARGRNRQPKHIGRPAGQHRPDGVEPVDD